MTLMQTCYWLIAILGNTLTLTWFNTTGSNLSLVCLLLTLVYSVIGAYDIFFSPHSLNRLYPVSAYIRYFLEHFRKEIHQYFVASETEELPFNREQRSLVYRRSKNVRDTIAFGTQRDLLEENYLSLWHSLSPKKVNEEHKRVLIGGPDCLQPYRAAYLNISAMSFGALSSQAIEALNLGAKKGQFSHNTGEGSVSPYHLKHGGDIVWQIGSGLFGCRTQKGDFCPDSFAKTANLKAIKMIEIKLSQGAKPGHGGVLPKAKITNEIARVRGVAKDKDCVSPAIHPECHSPKALLEFIQTLRNLSKGKPIGFKLCLGNPAEFLGICKAMLEKDIYPDFITVDGAEGGTGAAPVEFTNRLGMTCLDAVYLVNSMLIGSGIRKNIRIIASGKTASSFDLLSKIAAGADVVNAARTMMLAIGCIQSQACNTNLCPTGIATQDPTRGKAIDIEAKAKRVMNFQRNTLDSFFELVGSLGLDDPRKLSANMIKRRTNYSLSISLGVMIPNLKDGELNTEADLPYPWKQWWQGANSESYYVEDLHEMPPSELKIKML